MLIFFLNISGTMKMLDNFFNEFFNSSERLAMTNTLLPLLVIFLIKYIVTIIAYLYGLHLVMHFCIHKSFLHHTLVTQKHQAVIISSCLFSRQRLTFIRLVTSMKIVHTYQKYGFRLLQILRKHNP